MSSHVTDEMLLAAALDAETTAHLAACESCRVRARRLSAGAMLIEAVRRESVPPDIDWQAIDARILAAAESTARDIRSGRLRPAGRAVSVGYLGMSLAAAAAAAFLLRSALPHSDVHGSSAPVAVHAPQPAPTSGGERTTVPAVATATPVDGVVLLLASPVAYVPSGAVAAPMTTATVVHTGGRVATDDHGGRAVLALHQGYRVDVRPGAEVTFASLSTLDTRMVLTKGEARVDGPALADDSGTRVEIEAAGWTLHAKGGGFVAKLDGDVVRLRVMSGKVGVSRAGVAERDVNAGDEVELSQDGVGFRVVGRVTGDPSEIDVTRLSRDGVPVAVPALPTRATLRVVGGAALPANVVALRTSAPLDVQAEVGTDVWSAVLDPRAAGPGEWRRPARMASASAGHALPVGSEGVPLAPVVPPSPVQAPPVMAGAAPALDPAESAMNARERLEHQLASRAAACFAQCRDTNNCGLSGASSGDVAIDPDGDGHVVAVRVTGFSATDLNACIAREARVLSIPSYVIGTVQLHLVAPR